MDFQLYSIDGEAGDTIYLVTDGYGDQFGGPKGKKFMHRQLNELFLKIHQEGQEEQLKILKTTFEEWRGDHEQVDDVCIIGIRL
jgi:serine phosphatase RsbU (regulator of sigma subunit)